MDNRDPKMVRPKIIVYTHAYNVKKYILNALRSMLAQTYDNWEWYLTDNASTDGTSALIESFLEMHPDDRVHYFKRKYNTILQPGKEKDSFFDVIFPSLVGKGYYITSLDSDDYFAPNALEIMAEPVIKHGVDYVITGRQGFSEEKNFAPDLPVDRIFPNIADLCDVWQQNYICMRTVWGKLFLLDRYYEVIRDPVIQGMINGSDTYSNLLYQQKSHSAASVAQVTVHFCVRQSSSFHSIVFPKRYKAYVKIYEKTLELFQCWNRLDSENLSFAARVFWTSLLETIFPATRAIDAPQALKLLHNILTDQVVFQIFTKHQKYQEFINSIFEFLQKNVDIQKVRLTSKTEQYFHFWILKALLQLKKDPDDWHIASCCLLHGVLSASNQFQIGMDCLRNVLLQHISADFHKAISAMSADDMKKWNAVNPIAFKAMLCRDVDCLQMITTEEVQEWQRCTFPSRQEQEMIETYRVSVIEMLQKGNLKALTEKIEQLIRYSPLDYSVIYARMYLLCAEGRIEEAACIAAIVENLYPHNQILVDMAAMILEESGLSRTAYTLYQKNLFYAEEAQKERIQQALCRLKMQIEKNDPSGEDGMIDAKGDSHNNDI